MNDQEILIIQKATVYDLIRIFESRQNETYTVREIEEIIDTYIADEESKMTRT